MKILIRSPNWIGDAVLSTPSIFYLKEKMPQAHITILAKDWVKDIFIHHPGVDEIMSLEKSRFSLIKNIEKKRYGLGILFTNSFSSAFLFFVAGLRRRIGYHTNLRGIFLTERISLPQNVEKMHQRDYYIYLVKKLIPGDKIPEVRLYLNKKEEEKVGHTLKNYGIDKSVKIVGIGPGASYGASRRWPEEKFNSLIKEITKKYKAKILIFGSKEEMQLGNMIREGIEKDAINLSGKTTLRELMALIEKCSLFITNDTGPMHVASAFNVPIVAIFGPTNPSRTSPLTTSTIIQKKTSCSPCKHRVCPFNHECMEKITVEEVGEAVEKYLR